jgi:RND family efflux transporter MFP subunit
VKRKFLILSIVVIVVGLLAWRAFDILTAGNAQQQQAAGPRRPRGVPVQVKSAERGPVIQKASYTGEVTSRTKVDVVPRISGVVQNLAVSEGDVVRRGQLLALLDPKELRFTVERARANVATQRTQVARARANIATLRAQVDIARANVGTSRARLAQVQSGSANEQIRQAEEQLRQAQANLEFSRAQFRRTEDLFNQGFVARQALDAARTDVAVQEARVRGAEQQVQFLRQGPRPEELGVSQAQIRENEASLVRAQTSLNEGVAALQQSESVLREALVAQRQAESTLSESAIVAPASGVVARRMVDLGATVTTSTAVFQIQEINPIYVTVPVIERELAFLKPGLMAIVSSDAVPGEGYAGKIRSISPVLTTATRTAEVKIEVDNKDGRLRPGMFARVELILAQRDDAVTVPAEAILEVEGKSVVYTVVEGRAKARELETGISDGEVVEVVGGLKAGEQVVVTGQQNLRDGVPVFIPRRREGGAGPGGPGGGGAPGAGGPGSRGTSGESPAGREPRGSSGDGRGDGQQRQGPQGPRPGGQRP